MLLKQRCQKGVGDNSAADELEIKTVCFLKYTDLSDRILEFLDPKFEHRLKFSHPQLQKETTAPEHSGRCP